MEKFIKMKKLYEVVIFIIILFISLIICNVLKSLYFNKVVNNTNSKHLILKEGILFVSFIDAGKADAMVLQTNSSTVLIDTGLKNRGKKLVEFLKNQGIDSIDYLIITHFDKDHVGGAAKVIENFEVKNIITSDYFKESDEVEDYLKACDKADISPQILEKNISFILDNVNYTVYNHLASNYSEKESNNSSLIISVEHWKNRMLFTGDANDLRIEEFITKQETNFKYELLKIPYHGRYMKSLEGLVGIIKPEYAVITSSEKDKEDKETVEMLKDIDINVLLTRKGTISVISDGKTLNVKQ